MFSKQVAVTREGWLFSVGGVAYFTGAALNSVLSRKSSVLYFEALLLTASLTVSGVSQALLPFGRRRWLLGGLLFVSRLGAGSIDVSGNSIIAQANHASDSWMQCLHAFFSIGAFLAPLIIAFSLRSAANDIYLGFAIYSVIVLFSLALFLAYALALRSGSRDAPLDAQSAIGNGCGSGKDVGFISGLHRGGVRRHRWLQFLYHFARVCIVLLIFASYAGYEVSLGGWLAVYARESGRTGASLARADDIPALFWAAMMVGRLLAIWVSLHVSATTILEVCVLTSLMIWLATLWIPSHVYGMACGLGLAMSSAYAAQMSVSMELFRDRAHGAVEVAIWATIGSTLGEAILPWSAGVLMNRFGLEWFLYTGIAYTRR
ncbi:hypothetical protein F1559_004370 [Cyanidiococcus yangmingshanensis]|uniref:Uncharacterized protein n=1 Tax=Cyanidiococcus yangmingshanensis TaxID=2690220 RepID=A0A7J7IHH8_9RHOD|nr:hypothetical protein F1559_004370 [Cyanidiococcus yangmingshanensis]